MNTEDDKNKEITPDTTSDEIKDKYLKNDLSDTSKGKQYPPNKKKDEASVSDVKKSKDASITDDSKPSEKAVSNSKPSVKQSKKTFKKPTLSLVLSVAALTISIVAISKPSTEPDTGKLSYLYNELTQLKQATSRVAEIDHNLLRLNIERSMYLLPESERPTLQKMIDLLTIDSVINEKSTSKTDTPLNMKKSSPKNLSIL